MTRIGGSGHGTSEGFSLLPEGERRDLREHRDQFPGGKTGTQQQGLDRDTAFGQSGLGGRLSDDREDAFREKVRQALSHAEAADNVEDEKVPQRLVAIAADLPSTLPPQGARASDASAVAPGRAGWVGALVERIDQALRPEGGEGMRTGFSLRLDLADAGGGISGVTITMTSTAIDVVLARAGVDASSEYLLAAQALADRLQARFSRRVVRIHETEAEPTAKASQGMNEISRLLGHPGVRS